MIIEKTAGNINEKNIGDRRVEEILLRREDLARTHQKLKTSDGGVFALSLPRGEHLHPGDILFEDEERIVCLGLAEEDVLVIRPRDRTQWARAAYNIGNMHQSAYIREEDILVPFDGILASVMDRLEIPWEKLRCPLEGVRAGVEQSPPHHHHGEHDRAGVEQTPPHHHHGDHHHEGGGR